MLAADVLCVRQAGVSERTPVPIPPTLVAVVVVVVTVTRQMCMDHPPSCNCSCLYCCEGDGGVCVSWSDTGTAVV